MADPFDIFEVDTKEAVRWLGAAATLTEAQATIRRHGVDLSARYVVVDQKTGKKVTMDPAGLVVTSRAASAGRGAPRATGRRLSRPPAVLGQPRPVALSAQRPERPVSRGLSLLHPVERIDVGDREVPDAGARQDPGRRRPGR